MLKDVAAKLLFVPLLGLLIPVLSSVLVCNGCSVPELVGSGIFYIGLMALLWQGVVVITASVRNNSRIRKNTGLKVLLLIFGTGLFAVSFSTLFSALSRSLFSHVVHEENLPRYTLSFFAIAPVISLTYEIFFLQKEQDLDSKIVEQLDYERQSAELNVLKAELDPHFIFNSLNTLAPLISADAAKAQLFTIKLAQAYKYLLLKRDRELITLSDELRFIDDYFFLLQMRHPNSLKLDVLLNSMRPDTILILPFALQVLIENAIKHNMFSEEKPLDITIALTKQHILVSNTIHPKPYAVESTHVGLKNLSARYRLTCKQDIVVYQNNDTFLVKLPLIKSAV
jgi:two-component system LytT family sensor kinase